MKKEVVAMKAPSQTQQRRWQAEDVVRRLLTTGPAFERQVRIAMRELAKLEKQVKPSLIKPMSKKR